MRNLVRRCSALALGMLAMASVGAAEVIEEVVVTGSFIRGTPEDAALPVDVIGRDDLEAQGNPSLTEMVRNLNISNGNIGETNQFNASGGQGNEGVATINMRGLGSARTLVLINGRRHVSTATIGTDISAIPSLAIGRVEVLKDGAAALYGSDAIAGVVNFITRDTFEGLEIRAQGQDLDGSDGEYGFGAIGGWRGDRLRVMGAIEYDRRNKLTARDTGFAIDEFATNPQGGWSSIGNPGTMFALDAGFNTIGLIADPGCDTLGGVVSGGFCRFQFTNFDNVIEEQDTWRAYGEVNYDLTEAIDFHIEGMYSKMDMPDWNTSPSYPPQALTSPDRFVPLTHPGLADLVAQNPGLLPAGSIGVLTWSRMAGWGGLNGQPEDGKRTTDTYRIASSLNGELFDGQLGFDLAVSWSKRERRTQGPDMYVERMAFALDGLGGPNCDPSTGVPGVGDCSFYSPFSTAVLESAFGLVNPQGNAALAQANSDLFDWLTDDLGTDSENELLVVDLTLNGMTDWELGGGAVGWAAGLQARDEKFTSTPDAINDLTQNPCPFTDPFSVTSGNTASLDCAAPTGLFAFLSGSIPADVDRTIYGAFVELALPVTDTFDVQLAARFEDYGGSVGNTLDPKIAIRWQATDTVAFRGSLSSTFRGPPQNFLEGRATSLQFVTAALAFKAVDTVGNPDLEPETAIASNFGVIFDTDNFFGSLDWWRFDFEKPFQTEDFNGILSQYTARGCDPAGAGFGTPECDSLSSQIFFQAGSGQQAADVERFEISVINGADTVTSGFDWFAQYDFNVGQGLLSVGTQGTYIYEYDVDDFTNIDGVFVASGGDFAGLINDHRTPITPIVDLKGNVFAQYSQGIHRATLTARYWGDYEDDDPTAPANLTDVDDMLTVDFTYNVSLMDDRLGVNFSVFNMFDEDPPQTATDLNYDPYTHSPFGRMVKLGLRYTL